MPVPRVCLICQAPFLTSAYEVRRGYGKYCSRACWRVSNCDTLEERFLTFYPTIRPEDGCWLWTGKPNPNTGYGFVVKDGRYYAAHRLAYWFTVGAVPPKLFVLHKCDTPLCVRGRHLFLGTHRDNMADKARKGRGRHGGGNYRNAKLTPAQVRKIRLAVAEGQTCLALGVQYGLTPNGIWNLVNRRSWATVD